MARAVPVHRTSSYVFRDTRHAADLFGLRELGNIYTRLMNPTHAVLEERMATLEGGAGALVLSSGTSAVFYSLINCMEAGEEFISSQYLYGGTFTMFKDIIPKLGITPRLVDHDDLAAVKAAVNSQTRAIFIESIANPDLRIPDFEALAAIARDAPVPLIVDATFTTPYLFRVLDYGADVVVHSLTKWIGGHGTGIGGVVIDSGKFDWSDPKFGLFSRPEPSYFGLRFGHDLGELQPLAYVLRMRLVPLRNLGACMSPDNAWIFLQGLETLALRMERHCSNALAVARFLEEHEKVEWVRYPGLPSDHFTEWRNGTSAGAQEARWSFSGSKAGQRPVRDSSTASNSSRTWPTWGTRKAWRFILPAPPIRNCPRKTRPQRECFPISSGCRWG
jgi:O-acetylhomoserine (thiol)-lyase